MSQKLFKFGLAVLVCLVGAFLKDRLDISYMTQYTLGYVVGLTVGGILQLK